MRGAKLTWTDDGYVDWDEARGRNFKIAVKAITDVAVALGYVDVAEYNHACRDQTGQVRARLAAL